MCAKSLCSDATSMCVCETYPLRTQGDTMTSGARWLSTCSPPCDGSSSVISTSDDAQSGECEIASSAMPVASSLTAQKVSGVGFDLETPKVWSLGRVMYVKLPRSQSTLRRPATWQAFGKSLEPMFWIGPPGYLPSMAGGTCR